MEKLTEDLTKLNIYDVDKVIKIQKWFRMKQIDLIITKNKMKEHADTKSKLQQLLDSSRSNKIHTETIMKLPTLKDAQKY